MNGWSGTIARINLTTGAITKERTNLRRRCPVHRSARTRRQDSQRRDRRHNRSSLAGEQADFCSGTLLRNVCSFRRPVSCGDQRPVDGGYRGIELRRISGGRNCVTQVTTH